MTMAPIDCFHVPKQTRYSHVRGITPVYNAKQVEEEESEKADRQVFVAFQSLQIATLRVKKNKISIRLMKILF